VVVLARGWRKKHHPCIETSRIWLCFINANNTLKEQFLGCFLYKWGISGEFPAKQKANQLFIN